jgi:hypothetical protein
MFKNLDEVKRIVSSSCEFLILKTIQLKI